ncbi:MAG: hypothetical protein PHV39_07355 [Methanomicrobium sp.]|nr:hypothetical protein [Methanomicrobium sp.]
MYTCPASSLDLFTDSIRLMGDATLCGVMEFDRNLDPINLQKAAQACLMAHPVLHSRLIRKNSPAIWEMDNDVSVSPVHIEECGGNYHSLVAGPVDPYGPMQFRVRLLRRPSGDVIVINLAHAAADAFGLHTLMSQLLQEYQNPGSIPPAKGGIPKRDTLWTRELDPEVLSDNSDMKVINPLWPDVFGTSNHPSDFHREFISSTVLETVRNHARVLGGSINDVVIAAYFLSMSDLTGHMGPIDIFFPVNLRRYLNDGSRVMSNQAANVCLTLNRNPGEGMKDVLPRVIRETKLLKEKSIGIREQIIMDTACDPEGRQIHKMAEEMAALQKSGFADIFISNPGPINLPDIEGLTDAYVCYPGCCMPATCFVTSTFRRHMTITIGYQDSKRAREGTRKAMDFFIMHLLSLLDANTGTLV